MKIKLLILFLFIAFAGHAQLSEIYNNTTIVNRQGKFYEQQTIVYSDSTINNRETPLGDTATLVNRVVSGAIELSRQYAQVAVTAARKGIVINSLQGLDDALRAAVGVSVRDTIRNLLVYTDSTGAVKHRFEGTDYKFDAGAITDAAITRQANGSLRFRPDVTKAPTFGIAVFGDRWIRVNAYPTAGQFLDFFFDTETGMFISDTRQANGTPYRLRKASLAVIRTTKQ